MKDQSQALFSFGQPKLGQAKGKGQTAPTYSLHDRPQVLDQVGHEAGHPLSVLMAENDRILAMTARIKRDLASWSDDDMMARLAELRTISCHYGKKGDLLLTLLNRGYGVPGPSQNMWEADDRVRDALRQLEKDGPEEEDFKLRFYQQMDGIELMVQKENQVLFPLCLTHFSQEDWMRIYYDMRKYDTMLDAYPVWEEAEARRADLKTLGGKLAQDWPEGLAIDDPVPVGMGSMTPRQIDGLLNTIPMEITFVDDEGTNLFFSDQTPYFPRPEMAIGRDVYSCHTPSLEAIVRSLIDSFKAGREESMDVWMTLKGRPVLVRYFPVRDREGAYLGTVECVQDMSQAQAYFEGQAEV